MLAVVGTIPEADFPLLAGPVAYGDRSMAIQGHKIGLTRVTRGTPALLAAACTCLETLGQPGPFGFLVGDTGLGRGSEKLYEYLSGHLEDNAFTAIAFHYILPIVDWHNRVFFALEEMKPRPLLIADAGFMYVAKMSGLAPEYDLFTPDAGEMAFLADEEAPHPFYTRGFILHEENKVPELIARAYAHDNASRYLLVKGRTDYLADKSGVLATIADPIIDALEAIGGTGDTLTGIVSALIAVGYDIVTAATIAARVNRVAGYLAQPTPATGVTEIISQIPFALQEFFSSAPKANLGEAVRPG